MKSYQRLLFVFILLIFVAISVGSALSESLVFDEIVYRQEGLNHWFRRTFDIDTNNPPLVREIETIPLALGADKLIPSDIESLKIMPARIASILLGVALLLAVYWMARAYTGVGEALFAVFLLAYQPNILAHSHYLTLDIGTTLFIFLAFILLLRFAKELTRKRIVLVGLSLGASLSSRFMALPFFVVMLPYILIIQWKRAIIFQISRNLTKWIAIIAVAMLTVWATYFFRTNVIIAKRDDPNRVSTRLLTEARDTKNTAIVSLLNFGMYQKLPLGDYLAVVKNTMIRNTLPNKVFFYGSRYERTRWYFLPVNLLMKTPIAFWIFVIWGTYLLWNQRKNRKILYYFLVPSLLYVTLFSMTNSTPSVRYVLILYPFLSLVAANTIQGVKGLGSKIAFGLLITWYLTGVSGSYPHFISYANELAGPSNQTYLKFHDNNIDWGQSLPDLSQYIKDKNPNFVSLSYFGRDNGDPYGLVSNFPYGSYKFEDICLFHEIPRAGGVNSRMVAISITNWYNCGFYQQREYSQSKVADIVGKSILIFR